MVAQAADTTYNGWTNYETWCVHLWLSSTEWMDAECLRLAREAHRQGELEAVKAELAQTIRALVDEQNPLEGRNPSMFSNLLTGALDAADWHEIANAYIEAADL